MIIMETLLQATDGTGGGKCGFGAPDLKLETGKHCLTTWSASTAMRPNRSCVHCFKYTPASPSCESGPALFPMTAKPFTN